MMPHDTCHVAHQHSHVLDCNNGYRVVCKNALTTDWMLLHIIKAIRRHTHILFTPNVVKYITVPSQHEVFNTSEIYDTKIKHKLVYFPQ